MHTSPEVTAPISSVASESPTCDHLVPKPLTPTLAMPTEFFLGQVGRIDTLSLPPHCITHGPENRAELPLPITGEAMPQAGEGWLWAGEGLPTVPSSPSQPGGRMQTLLSSALPIL